MSIGELPMRSFRERGRLCLLRFSIQQAPIKTIGALTPACPCEEHRFPWFLGTCAFSKQGARVYPAGVHRFPCILGTRAITKRGLSSRLPP